MEERILKKKAEAMKQEARGIQEVAEEMSYDWKDKLRHHLHTLSIVLYSDDGPYLDP